MLDRYESYEVLSFIDSCSQYVEREETKKRIIISKIRALHHAEEHQDLIKYSNKMLLTYPNDTYFLIQIHVWRALTFEYVDAFKDCKTELEKANSLIQNNLYTKYHTVLLYRYSSYYRVTKQDSLAKQYAYRALHQSQKYNQKHEEAVANMILSLIFLKEGQTELSLYHSKASLNYWWEIKDPHGAESMLLNIVRIYEKEKKYDSTFLYIEKGFYLSNTESNVPSLKEVLYHLQADVYAKQDKYEMAFEALQNAILEGEKIQLIKQRKLTLELEYKFRQEKQADEIANLATYNKNLLIAILTLFVLTLLLIYLLFVVYKSRKERILQNTVLEQLLFTKQLLLEELQHRVKNNFALINSLVDQHIFNKKLPNMELLQDLKNRVHTISLAQNLLFQEYDKEQTVQKIDSKRYVEESTKWI